MKRPRTITIVLYGVAAWLPACHSMQRDAGRSARSAFQSASQETAVNNAIIAQHTLFPYHFVANGSALDELGLYDLAVLTAHFIKYPGELNVRRGDATPELYSDRVNVVIELLSAGGVDTNRVATRDAPAGGDGRPAEQVLAIMEADRELRAAPAPTARRGGVGVTGAGS